MDTVDEHRPGPNEPSTSDAISELGVDVQVMFQRVCAGLGLSAPDEPSIGRYRIRTKLGEGGMGVVYLAYDPKLEREVAVKIVTARPLSDPDKLRERLLREAQLLAKLRHPNVVRVYDTGEHAGEVFLAMEYVDGQSLREWQETSGRTREQLLRLYVEAGRGLAAAHAEGIIHRDFKPDNVFVSAKGRAMVGDFGLAHLLDEELITVESDGSGERRSGVGARRMTETGELLGTRGYMSPEQLRGDEVDARTDQYAFCVSLWEALSGRRPYDGATREALLEALRGAEPRGDEGLPPWLRRALRTGLAVEPERRHASMDELVAALERGLGRRQRWTLGGVFGLAGVLALGGTWALTVSEGESAVDECSTADELELKIETLARDPEWKKLLERLDWRTRYVFERELQELAAEAEAREACDVEDSSVLQYEKGRINQFEEVAHEAPNLTSGQLGEVVAELERGRVAGPPPKPLSEGVERAVQELVALEDKDSLMQMIRVADKLLKDPSKSSVDRVELLLHRGRARFFSGDIEGALEDLRLAVNWADEESYDDARIRAHLLIAKAEVMRLEQLEDGRETLRRAAAVLERVDEPLLSPRRTDLLEITAAADKRGNDTELEKAARTQQLVVLRHMIAGSRFELAAALTNLGTIEEYRAKEASSNDQIEESRRHEESRRYLEAAEHDYRTALKVVPDDPEAAINLARLLANRGEDEELSAEERAEALRLLKLVLASERGDLHVLARTAGLQLALQTRELPAIAEARDQLVALLKADPSVTPSHRAQAWANVVFAHATLGELGAAYADAYAELEAAADEPLLAMVERASIEAAERALARLESLPDSEPKAAQLAALRAQLDELEPSDSP